MTFCSCGLIYPTLKKSQQFSFSFALHTFKIMMMKFSLVHLALGSFILSSIRTSTTVARKRGKCTSFAHDKHEKGLLDSLKLRFPPMMMGFPLNIKVCFEICNVFPLVRHVICCCILKNSSKGFSFLEV